MKIEGDPLNTQHAQHRSVQATDLEFNMVFSSIWCLAPDKVVEQELSLLVTPLVLEVFPPLPVPFDESLKLMFFSRSYFST